MTYINYLAGGKSWHKSESCWCLEGKRKRHRILCYCARNVSSINFGKDKAHSQISHRRFRFLYPRNEITQKCSIKQNHAPGKTKPAKNPREAKLLAQHCERYTQITHAKLLWINHCFGGDTLRNNSPGSSSVTCFYRKAWCFWEVSTLCFSWEIAGIDISNWLSCFCSAFSILEHYDYSREVRYFRKQRG